MEEKVFGLPANSLANSMIVILIIISIIFMQNVCKYSFNNENFNSNGLINL